MKKIYQIPETEVLLTEAENLLTSTTMKVYSDEEVENSEKILVRMAAFE